MIEHHRHYDECASTNDIARSWARDAAQPAPEGSVVTAGFQTAGRGRRGRVWRSEPGDNALMSIVLRPPYPIDEAWKLAFVAGLAVHDALVDFKALPQLKWPNDILVDGYKISGILVETETLPSTSWAAVVGVGVNVNQPDFPREHAYDIRPTSMRIAIGDEFSVDDVVGSVHTHLLAWEMRHRQEGFAAVVEHWQRHMAVGYEIARGGSRGIQSRLLDDGRLEVELPDGSFTVWGTLDE